MGIFSSSLLVTVSSIIGYIIEEKRLLGEYYWNLSVLKTYALELQTIPSGGNTLEKYCDAFSKINVFLKTYFATVDVDFFLIRRKKIQKLLEIQTKLELLVNTTGVLLIHYHYFLGGRNYSAEDLKRDVSEAMGVLDNYDDSGDSLTIWLDKKGREYGEAMGYEKDVGK